MNNKRRKQIDAVAIAIYAALDELEQIADGEQDAFDNLPEALQESERGLASERAAESLYDAAAEIGSVLVDIEFVTD
jgi:hypothetical protein